MGEKTRSFAEEFARAGSYTIEVVDGTGGRANCSVTIAEGAGGSGVAENQAPIAIATANPMSATIGKRVAIDGSMSLDPDGDSLTYEWNILSPAGALFRPVSHTSPRTTFTLIEEGEYMVTLNVSDGKEKTGAEVFIIAAVSTGGSIPTSAGYQQRAVSAGVYNDGVIQNVNTNQWFEDINANDQWDFADCVILAQNLTNPDFIRNIDAFDFNLDGQLLRSDAEQCTTMLIEEIQSGVSTELGSIDSKIASSLPTDVSRNVLQRVFDALRRWFRMGE